MTGSDRNDGRGGERDHGSESWNKLRTDFLRLRAALRDPSTGLYALPVHFHRVRELMSGHQRIGVLWAGLTDGRLAESVFGWQAYDQMVVRTASFLRSLVGGALPETTVLATSGVHADAFVLFVPTDARGEEIDAAAIANLCSRIKKDVELHLEAHITKSGPVRSGLSIGAALLADNPFHRFERCVYQSVEEARALATGSRELERLSWVAELQRLVRENDVHCCFQKIVDLDSGETVALEAFARGPSNSALRLPRVMFALGREAGVLRELDRLCRVRAISEAPSAAAGKESLLFINTAAENVADPEWQAPETLDALARRRLSPRSIVLDIPERQIVGDLAPYRGAVDALRRAGFRICLDDLGSGPRSLELIDSLEPEFVKFDLALIRYAPDRQLSRELLRSLVEMGTSRGAKLIVERVETDEERALVKACGARWGQGYSFGVEFSVGGAGAPASTRADARGSARGLER